ncbi:MAG: hypothetical protein HC806_08420 [Anaerolineae bacterium]|nr:hypothetical protein [Anaerolineae bacterium]
MFEGANHFSFAYPVDPTTGRHFLETPPTANEGDLRALMADIIVDFLHNRTLAQFEGHPLIGRLEC